MKNVVYIYNDEGVSQESLDQSIAMFELPVKTLTAQQVQDNMWSNDAALFVMPGGFDIPYVRKLKGQGNNSIKQFVKNGGTYLGICAGSYYAGSSIEFDKGSNNKVIGDRELQFFAGKVIGPILAPYDFKICSGCRAAEISTVFGDVPKATVYYNGGGFFEDAHRFPGTQVIATYDNDLPAIINIEYGQGNVLLSAVHFEYDPYTLDDSDPYLKNILPELMQSNEARSMLAKHILVCLCDIKI